MVSIPVVLLVVASDYSESDECVPIFLADLPVGFGVERKGTTRPDAHGHGPLDYDSSFRAHC